MNIQLSQRKVKVGPCSLNGGRKRYWASPFGEKTRQISPAVVCNFTHSLSSKCPAGNTQGFTGCIMRIEVFCSQFLGYSFIYPAPS